MPIQSAFIVPHPPLLVPEVGRGQENKVNATTRAYETVSKKIAALHPDTVVVISPHSVLYADYIHISPGKSASGNFRQFG
ncbi:MAG: AmmeMemoRadiSam system protein A, partial [Eubacteriales bacterium]|nr:AmmeMemoRadiSam system protein A [Eubacteriales bacterium]